MTCILRFLEHGTAELRRAFAESPDVRRLVGAGCDAGQYRGLLERLRRGFAVVELQVFEDLPDELHRRLKAHRATWRLRHDIGILGGAEPLPARSVDLENAGAFATTSAKLGGHFALATVLEVLAEGRRQLERSLGPTLVSCLLFNGERAQGEPRTAVAVRVALDASAPAIDWAEALAGARRTFRTIRHALADSEPAA